MLTIRFQKEEFDIVEKKLDCAWPFEEIVVWLRVIYCSCGCGEVEKKRRSGSVAK